MRRIPQLDGLRALAILMVFATHAFGVPVLWIGVDLFFVLSGYLITGILLRLKDTRAVTGKYWSAFYSRRVRRILPPYFGFLIFISLTFPHLPWRHFWYWYILPLANFPVALRILPLAAFSPLWSLAVEEQFYIVWPFIILLCSRRTMRRVAIGIVLFSPILRAIFTSHFSTHFPIYTLTIFRADTLATGAFLAHSEQSNSQWIAQRKTSATVVGLLSVALFGALSLFAPGFRTSANSILFNSLGYSLIALFFGCTLLYTLAIREGFIYSVLTWTPVRYLGIISYTFYLYHEVVIGWLRAYFHSTVVVAAFAFLLTTAISAASWHLMEKRILAFHNKPPRPQDPSLTHENNAPASV